MNAHGRRERAIQSFFDTAGAAGLLLPNGWFGGRPMENHHRLTLVVDRPHHLIVELDSQVLLIFSGNAVVSEGRSDLALAAGTPSLTIGAFSQCVFERLGYGDLQPHVDVFRDGSVQFVAAR